MRPNVPVRSSENFQTTFPVLTCFDYNGNSQLIAQHQWKVPSKEENARNGLPETDWRDAQYDMLYLPVTESIRYHYDFNGNRTATVLPDGRQINYLYYGSGHLHQISLDDEVISDIERDRLHREIYRTQGKLASRYELDPLGRLKRQIATLNDLTEGGKGKTKVAAGYSQTAVKRSYGYDRTGNLTHSTDQRTGTTHFKYDKLGRITQAGNEVFAFDPAHNILSDNNSPTVPDNRLKTYNGSSYYYDHFGNLIHRELADGEVQNYFYDLHDQLVKAEIFKKDGTKETWAYTYDALGRRIGKGRLKNEEVSDGLEEETRFVWDGSHLLQEIQPDGRYTYLYTDPDSYEPLAQVHNRTNEEGESKQETHYFHCDQVGIPREMTDKDGNLVWFGDYYGWGKLKSETNVTDSAYQPFRLQNQYADRETGLHYNFFRYYEPDAGRFVNQDPIGLMGGENFYAFAPNAQVWVDPLGLNKCCENSKVKTEPNTAFFWSGRTDGIGGQHIAADIAKSNGGTTLEMLIEARKIIMPKWDQNNQASIKAWEDISSEYATCASGTVTGVIGKDLRPGNIWENRELPALKNNPNITKIVIIDPKTKISTVIFQR